MRKQQLADSKKLRFFESFPHSLAGISFCRGGYRPSRFLQWNLSKCFCGKWGGFVDASVYKNCLLWNCNVLTRVFGLWNCGVENLFFGLIFRKDAKL